ncbi:MAG: ABC transporter permease [Gemmatimonadetes bacterium]|nr:ABC transporter permease [Gemmatimonadota bacterium]NNK65072.1 ABC transporter permease [Gemmatimonadota bacterium]
MAEDRKGGFLLDWFIARRYLSARRGGRFLSFITWISLGGVTVGVTALIVVIGVMTGMQDDLRGKILSSTAHIMVVETGQDLRMADWRPVLDTARATPGVRSASPFIFSSVSLVRNQYSRPADLYGVPVDSSLAGGTELEEMILSGFYDLEPPESGLPPILLGSGIAEMMQLFRGDTITVLAFENLQTSVMGMAPALRRFEVTGTFRTGMYDYDTKNVYVRLPDAQDLLDLAETDAVSGIGMQLDDPEDAVGVAVDIQDRLGFPYVAQSWVTQNAALFSALKLEKLAMGLILFLIVLVAAFNIVSMLVMVVADRTREIGILKSMGMTDRGILRVFVLQGAWIGIVGTVLGTLLGVLLCVLLDRYELIKIPPDVYFIERLPVSLRLRDVLTIVGASVAVAFVATIYPSIQASRLQPVDAIRHD